jgi:hypothetical protein
MRKVLIFSLSLSSPVPAALLLSRSRFPLLENQLAFCHLELHRISQKAVSILPSKASFLVPLTLIYRSVVNFEVLPSLFFFKTVLGAVPWRRRHHCHGHYNLNSTFCGTLQSLAFMLFRSTFCDLKRSTRVWPLVERYWRIVSCICECHWCFALTYAT